MESGRPRRALVLSGGGARGAYEAGVVTALFEREDFDIVCGTSIGAINAALAAQGATDRLRAVWRGVPERAVIRGVTPFHEFLGAFGKRGLRRNVGQIAKDVARVLGVLPQAHPNVLRRLTHLLDPAPIVALLSSVLDYGELKRTLIVGVTNLTRARPEAFYAFPSDAAAFQAAFVAEETGCVRLGPENYTAAILASAAIPLAFPFVSLVDSDGERCDYIDGGVGNNTPLRQAIDAGADDVTVVVADHIALRERGHRMHDLGSIALVAQDILQQQVLELDLKLTRRVNESVLRGGAPGKRFVRIRTIGPTVAIPLPILGFADLATIDRAFDQGLIDGRGACDASGLTHLFDTDPTARRVAAGDVLFAEGEATREMYVVVEGEFALTFREHPVATLRAGEIFGELALLGHGPARATATAKTDGIVAPVDRARFEYLVRFAPSFALVVLRSLAELLHGVNDTIGAQMLGPLDPAGAKPEPGAHVGGLRDDASTLAFPAGTVIYRAGDAAGAMYVVVDGVVDVRSDADGSVMSAGPGAVFGEMALCAHEARTGVATARTQTHVVPIDALRFTEMVQNNPRFAIEVMHTMADRVAMQVDSLDL
jgi:NTE family protein